jgi:drug/metabolite transporter (DMT)-like permease
LQLLNNQKLGIALAIFGGLIISIDIPVIRLALTDPWTFMMLRGLGMSFVLGLVMVFAKGYTQTPDRPFHDPDFIIVGTLYGVSSIFFTLSVFTTSTANLVFILALNPLAAAVLAWFVIGEKPALSSWIAIGFTIIGVGIIVSEGVDTGTTLGDGLAFCTAIVLAASVVMARRSGKDMSLAGTLGGLIAALFAMPMAVFVVGLQFGVYEWILLNVLIMTPAGAFALSLAPKFIPAPQVALFFLLETVLAPVWVWLIFSEKPSSNTVLGGIIVLSAISAHSFFQIRNATQHASKPA